MYAHSTRFDTGGRDAIETKGGVLGWTCNGRDRPSPGLERIATSHLTQEEGHLAIACEDEIQGRDMGVEHRE